MYQALECCAQDAIGPGGSWAAVMDSGLVNNLGARAHEWLPAWAMPVARQRVLASVFAVLRPTRRCVPTHSVCVALTVQASTASTATAACETCCVSSATSTTTFGAAAGCHLRAMPCACPSAGALPDCGWLGNLCARCVAASSPLACRELPMELQKKVGPLPDGFLAYFATRHVWHAMHGGSTDAPGLAAGPVNALPAWLLEMCPAPYHPTACTLITAGTRAC